MISFYTTAETWLRQPPQMGDHIRVMRLGGLYAHHGVYVSDDEVIHFTGQESDSILDWSRCEVIRTDLAAFLKGGTLEVKDYSDEEFADLYTPEQIVTYARACVGNRGYHLAFNNCEHFANVCTLGRFRSNQVDRVLSGKYPNQNEGGPQGMGLFKGFTNVIKRLLGKDTGPVTGGVRKTESYEPDKLRIAQVQANTSIRLSEMETERIELLKQAKLEILEYETQSRIALDAAKAQSLGTAVQMITAMQEKLNDIAEKRLLIIEKGSLQLVRELETFYAEIGDRIDAENDAYVSKKLPALLELLEKYTPGTSAYELYQKQIDDNRVLQQQHYLKQLDAVAQRQSMVLSSLLSGKERILEQTGNMTKDLLDAVKTQTPQFGIDTPPSVALPNPAKEPPALPDFQNPDKTLPGQP